MVKVVQVEAVVEASVVQVAAEAVSVAQAVEVAVNSDGHQEAVTFAVEEQDAMVVDQIVQEIEVEVLIADRGLINQDIEDVNSIQF